MKSVSGEDKARDGGNAISNTPNKEQAVYCVRDDEAQLQQEQKESASDHDEPESNVGGSVASFSSLPSGGISGRKRLATSDACSAVSSKSSRTRLCVIVLTSNLRLCDRRN